MVARTSPSRLNIYLEDPGLAKRVRVEAARLGMTMSGYCETAIRMRLLADEGPQPRRVSDPEGLERRMDELARRIGPIGIPTSELVREGRRD